MSEGNIAEVTTEVKGTTAPATAPEVKAPATIRDLHEVATMITASIPGLLVRPTSSTGYRILGTVEKTDENWKKGLFYVVNRYSKGFNLEMQAYSVKKGAHLVPYNERLRALATDTIKVEAFGYAVRLRTKLPDALTNEELLAAATTMINHCEPTLAAIREELVMPAPAAKKVKKVKAPVVSKENTPAPAEVAPVVEAQEPVVSGEVAPVVEAQEPVVSNEVAPATNQPTTEVVQSPASETTPDKPSKKGKNKNKNR